MHAYPTSWGTSIVVRRVHAAFGETCYTAFWQLLFTNQDGFCTEVPFDSLVPMADANTATTMRIGTANPASTAPDQRRGMFCELHMAQPQWNRA